MMRRVSVLAGMVGLACGGNGARDESAPADSAGANSATANGAVVSQPGAAAYSFQGEHAGKLGRVPILEYHVVGDSNAGMFVISREQFRNDLKLLYERGYRPMTVAQLIEKDFSAIPAGMSPVVFTFDDASPAQFAYVERDGRVEIDSNSVVGIWMDFAKRHPDWKGRATFCMLPAGDAGHAFFGDKPRYMGQKPEWRHQKVKWLADNGFELCNHTLWHAQLSKYPDAFVQEQIARGQLAIDSAVPGYRVRTFSLPQGLWPKNRQLAWKGSWTNPADKRTITYDYETVLNVAGGPTRSPFDPELRKGELNRVIAFGNEVRQTLDRLDKSKARFVWSGSPEP